MASITEATRQHTRFLVSGVEAMRVATRFYQNTAYCKIHGTIHALETESCFIWRRILQFLFSLSAKSPPKNSTCQLLCLTHQLTGGRKSPGRSMLCCNRASKFLIYRVPLHQSACQMKLDLRFYPHVNKRSIEMIAFVNDLQQ